MDLEINATNAVSGRYPYIAQIVEVAQSPNPMCGPGSVGTCYSACTGMLITPWLVLTAAHCFFETSATFSTTGPNQFYVFVGQGVDALYTIKQESWNLDPVLKKLNAGTEMRRVKEVVRVGSGIINTGGQKLDYALAILDSPVTTIAPVKVSGLTVSNVKLRTGMTVTSLGYGYSTPGKTAAPMDLLVNTFKLTEAGNPVLTIVPKKDGSGICQGDSGGPLIVQGSKGPSSDVVVAITSGLDQSPPGIPICQYTGKEHTMFIRTDSMRTSSTIPSTIKKYASVAPTTKPAPAKKDVTTPVKPFVPVRADVPQPVVIKPAPKPAPKTAPKPAPKPAPTPSPVPPPAPTPVPPPAPTPVLTPVVVTDVSKKWRALFILDMVGGGIFFLLFWIVLIFM